MRSQCALKNGSSPKILAYCQNRVSHSSNNIIISAAPGSLTQETPLLALCFRNAAMLLSCIVANFHSAAVGIKIFIQVDPGSSLTQREKGRAPNIARVNPNAKPEL